MNAFTTSHKDPLTAAAASVLFTEDVATIEKIVGSLKPGDKTNFGVVKEIGTNFISFKARDTGITKIPFNQRKMGSKDFVLDKLLKLKESVNENFADAIAKAKENFIKTIEDSMRDELLLKRSTMPRIEYFAAVREIDKKVSDYKKKLDKITIKESVEDLDEGISFAALAKAQKKIPDEELDKFVKAAKEKKLTDKQINAMLLTGRTKLSEELDENYMVRSTPVKKAMNIIKYFDADETEELLIAMKEYFDKEFGSGGDSDFRNLIVNLTKTARDWKNRKGN